MKRIRFYFGAGYVGTGGYEDILVEDDETEESLEQMAEDVMRANIPERGCRWKEIADDDNSWEGD